MVARFVVAVVALAGSGSGVARADVSARLAAGGGGETTGDEGSQHAMASVDLAASLSRLAPELERRGIHLCPIEATGCLWVFTGLDPDQVEGVGLTADASFLIRGDGPIENGLLFGGEVWGTWAGWRLGLRGDVQPVGNLRDAFWRSGRGVVEQTLRVDFGALWAIGAAGTELIVMPAYLALGARTAYLDGERRDAGFDRDAGMVGARIQHGHSVFDLFTLHYVEYGVATETVGPVTYGTSASLFDVDFGSLRLHLADGLELRAKGGLGTYEPVAPFEIHGNSESSTGPIAIVPSYWGELAIGNADQVALGGGSWTRLDPSGHAVDRGHLGTASFARHRSRYDLRGELQLGKLRRILVGDRAPMGIDPVGTRAWMGRGSLEVGVRVPRSIQLTLASWVERSDRDDPRWGTPTAGLATRTGLDLTAAWAAHHGHGSPKK